MCIISYCKMIISNPQASIAFHLKYRWLWGGLNIYWFLKCSPEHVLAIKRYLWETTSGLCTVCPWAICDQWRSLFRWYHLILVQRYGATAGLYLTSRPLWSPPPPVYLMTPLSPVPALSSATAALQSSGPAALSLLRVPRTDTASTWDNTEEPWASELSC